ncbi:GDP-L-fucose synthase [Escherichia coli]|uniref:GDP-L-fucose synthase n=2 Tax=Escherichia coli TaxID=562 RepID=E2DNM3_ECOLX|nr:GDP-L-fucose synthase [Escherichia coli]EIQ70050.1 GDP-L-fucose synthase [Escherichia coli EPEC C342-62]ADN43851.1 Fcl [Escherichia coli]EFG4449883.1 GDP-L-fucose synthase [Escherichia coli]EGE1564664.1 GDP-L-fucose synthase [Escherichia coli]CTS75225.1 GDP-L-fucose synthetase [Escherichia coli]
MKMKKIYIAGHRGMVGSAIKRQLMKNSSVELIFRSSHELDLMNQDAVQNFFNTERIDEVYLAAAKVGGIYANNKYPADFIYNNILIQANVINSAHRAGVQKLLFLGSSCIYPKFAEQPIKEESLLCGSLEPTNEPYAIAKITGIKLCESYNRQYGRDYRSVMPTNLYGPNDNFHHENSHVLPALIRRFHEAKINNLPEVSVWGSGNALREFLHVDDMAAASIYIMNLPNERYKEYTKPECSHINVGSGKDYSIRQLAEMVAEITNYKGNIYFDSTKPDGTLRKLMSNERLSKLGWSPKIELYDGVKDTYQWFLNNIENIRK